MVRNLIGKWLYLTECIIQYKAYVWVWCLFFRWYIIVRRHKSYSSSLKHKIIWYCFIPSNFLTIHIIKICKYCHTLYTLYYFILQTCNTGINESHSNFQMYLVLNCMPVLCTYNWKCTQKMLCPRKFKLFRYTRYNYIDHTCVNIK